MHKKLVAEAFSQDSTYWQSVYEEKVDRHRVAGPIQGGALVNREMVDRKNAVVSFIDKYAAQQKLLALDLGCGAGMIAKDVLKRGHTVIGADITQAMLQQAKAVLSQFTPNRARLVMSDAENIPFQDGSFDVVLCVGVLQYLETDQKAIAEISRVLRDGGLAIITLPNIFRINNVFDPYSYLVKGVQFMISRRRLKRRKTKTPSPQEFIANASFANRRYYYGQLADLFARSNLTHIATRAIGFGPLTIWRRELLPASVSMRLSCFMQNQALKTHFRFLNVFSNRWAICLKKGKSENAC